MRIYIPVKAVPDTPLGVSEITFEIEGILVNTETGEAEGTEPFILQQSVSVEVVHPTSMEATDVSSVDPSLFFGWRGELPDWSVMDTRTTQARKSAPLAAWLVVFVPPAVLLGALVWVFATKRL